MKIIGTRKGSTVIWIVIAASVLLMAALAVGSFADIGPLNIIDTEDGCWRPAPEHNNNSFSSEQELRDYASQRDIEVPGNISFKTINGTLYQEAECIGGSGG